MLQKDIPDCRHLAASVPPLEAGSISNLANVRTRGPYSVLYVVT